MTQNFFRNRGSRAHDFPWVHNFLLLSILFAFAAPAFASTSPAQGLTSVEAQAHIAAVEHHLEHLEKTLVKRALRLSHEGPHEDTPRELSELRQYLQSFGDEIIRLPETHRRALEPRLQNLLVHADQLTAGNYAMPPFATRHAGDTVHKGAVSATISGRVFDAVTNAPQADAYVQLFDFQGYSVTATHSLDDGSYTLAVPIVGLYFVGVEPNLGSYLSTFYPNQTCWSSFLRSCEGLTSIEPIVISEIDTTVVDIDLPLYEGAQITGRVIDRGTGLGVEGAIVRTYVDGRTRGSDVTDSLGRYRLTGLSNVMRTLAVLHDGFENQAWDGIPCSQYNCEDLGDPFLLGPNEIQSGIDFTLDALGGISGTLTDAITGEPVYGDVTIINDTGTFSQNMYNVGDGTFRFGGLPPGTYYARASNYGDHQAQVWPGIDCFGPCPEITEGSPIEVVRGEDSTGIDFVLIPYGAITVNLTDSKGSAAGGSGRIYDSAGNISDYLYSVGNGVLESDGLLQGSYQVVVVSSNHEDELWQDLPCPEYNCDTTEGDPVSVESGRVTELDIALTRLGTLSGSILSAVDGEPPPYADLWIYNDSGQRVADLSVNLQGRFQTSLEAGTYYLLARGTGYVNELWPGIPCEESCDVTAGTPIVVINESEHNDLDFVLDRIPSLTVELLDFDTGNPITDYNDLRLYDAQGNFVTRLTGYGYRFSFQNLEPGRYHLVSMGDPGDGNYPITYWENSTCAFIDFAERCPVTDSTPIEFAADTPMTIQFRIRAGAQLRGTLEDKNTGEQLLGTVSLYDAFGDFVDSDYINGHWTLQGLAPGTYFLTGRSDAYTSGLLGGIVCGTAGCDPLEGTPVAVGLGGTVEGLTIALTPYGRARGTVSDATTSAPIEGARVVLYSVDSYGVYGTDTDANGQYTIESIRSGLYSLYTVSPEHIDAVYGGTICEETSCSGAPGTEFEITLDSITAIDVEMEPGPGITGTLTATAKGIPISNAGVDLWDMDGDYVASGITNSAGFYRILGLDPGHYYVSTDNSNGYVDAVYGGVLCPDGPAFDGLCDPAAGTSVEMIVTPLTTVDFGLEGTGSLLIFSDGFEAGNTSNWLTP